MYQRVLKAIEYIKKGKMVILVDDEDRENEGDLCFAAEFTTPEHINFMAKHARGLICLTLTPEWTEKLDLPLMVPTNRSRYRTGFTVSIEAREGVTTGISAADRSHTILTAINSDVKSSDIVSPGHIFPLKAKKGGVLVRTGQTEGSIDLAKISGVKPTGVICEIMNDDGTMARMPELEKFSKKFNIPIVTIEDIIKFRLQHETLIKSTLKKSLNTAYGKFNAVVFSTSVGTMEHLALIKGDISKNSSIPVRVHREHLMGDIFGIYSDEYCSPLQASMELINKEGKGVILYLRDEQNSDFLTNFLKRDNDSNKDLSILPKESVLRDFGIGAQILRSLGVHKIKLITNNPKKVIGLDGYGLEIEDYISIN